MLTLPDAIVPVLVPFARLGLAKPDLAESPGAAVWTSATYASLSFDRGAAIAGHRVAEGQLREEPRP